MMSDVKYIGSDLTWLFFFKIQWGFSFQAFGNNRFDLGTLSLFLLVIVLNIFAFGLALVDLTFFS